MGKKDFFQKTYTNFLYNTKRLGPEKRTFTLFLRSHKGVALTPEGEKLFASVQIAQEQLQAAEAELASDKKLAKGTVSLGVSETVNSIV